MGELPKAGEWWVTSWGPIVYVVGRLSIGGCVVEYKDHTTQVIKKIAFFDGWRHLKDCTNFDWEEPKTESVHPLDRKLSYLKSCILDGSDEDALEHVFDLVKAVRLRKSLPQNLTPDGRELRALIE